MEQIFNQIFQAILHIFFVCAVADIITIEHIFEPLRKFIEKTFSKENWMDTAVRTLFNCPVCMSFWISVWSITFFPLLIGGTCWFVWPFVCVIATKIISNRFFTL